MTAEELEHGIKFYLVSFGAFVCDFYGEGNDMLSISIRKRADVESGYWVTITWIDSDGDTHQVEAQWRRLAWRRLFETFIRTQGKTNFRYWNHEPYEKNA